MTFWSALILGLIASPHCAGMCGGLQLAFQSGTRPQVAVRSAAQQRAHLLLLNLGRITTYVLAGAGFAWLGLGLVSQLNIPQISQVLRTLAAIVILLIGLQLLWQRHRPFHYLEGLGAALWRRVNRWIKFDSARYQHSYISGLAWGFLPCGLVYGVVLSAVFAPSLLDSALVMLGFGVGTLPVMLLTGTAYQAFRAWHKSSVVQIAGGIFFILGGLLMLTAPWWVSKAFLKDYPQLLNLVFCIT